LWNFFLHLHRREENIPKLRRKRFHTRGWIAETARSESSVTGTAFTGRLMGQHALESKDWT
jgi:hypothetical protein